MKESDQWEIRTYHKYVNFINQISETDSIYRDIITIKFNQNIN